MFTARVRLAYAVPRYGDKFWYDYAGGEGVALSRSPKRAIAEARRIAVHKCEQRRVDSTAGIPILDCLVLTDSRGRILADTI